MSNSKLTLIIDGNWLLMSRISVIQNKYTDVNKLCNDLKLLMLKSISIVLKQFPLIDNVILVSDGGSWRNKIDVPKYLKDQGIEYKGNREHTEGVDWDAVFAAYESFTNTFQRNGITVLKEMGVEGDDWMWYLSTEFNKQGTNVVLWSRDKDLTQLVRTDENGCFTVCWNKEGGLTCEEKNEDEINFLFNPYYNENENLFKSISDKSKAVNKINPHDIVIDKIIRGDQSDNIQSIILRKSKNGSTRLQRVSNKDLDLTLDIHDENAVDNYITTLLESKSYVGRVDKTYEDIIEHFKYNKCLVTLEAESYPPEIIKLMQQHQSELNKCNKDISEVEYQIQAEANNITSILNII